jgi:hypothetical protein
MQKINSAFIWMLVIGFISACSLQSAIPRSPYYPFGKEDLATIRAIAKAERIQDSTDLALAWELYKELENSWAPGAPKPSETTISKLDTLKGRLEGLPKPKWFEAALNAAGPPGTQMQLPQKIGDGIFVDQTDDAGYQNQKALAVVYMAEHEIDRPSGANNAGRYLTLLTFKHTWDWEVHALYARLLSDAGLRGPALHEAVLGIYLNPDPDGRALDYFAFICANSKKIQWDGVQMIIKDAVGDRQIAEAAIERSKRLFDPRIKATIVPPKIAH